MIADTFNTLILLGLENIFYMRTMNSRLLHMSVNKRNVKNISSSALAYGFILFSVFFGRCATRKAQYSPTKIKRDRPYTLYRQSTFRNYKQIPPSIYIFYLVKKIFSTSVRRACAKESYGFEKYGFIRNIL